MKVYIFFAFLVAAVYAADSSNTTISKKENETCDLDTVDDFFNEQDSMPFPKTLAEADKYCAMSREVLDTITKKQNVCIRSNFFRHIVRIKMGKFNTVYRNYCSTSEKKAKLVEMFKCVVKYENEPEFALIKNKRVASYEKAITFTGKNLRSGLCAARASFYDEAKNFVYKKCGKQNLELLEKEYGYLYKPNSRYCGPNPHSHSLLNQLDKKEKEELTKILSSKTSQKTEYKTVIPYIINLYNKFAMKMKKPN